MSALSINVPFPVFNDRDGEPLEAGYVWIGEPYLDPHANPIAVYFDDALTIQAPQPLRTLNGYVSRQGSPAQLYIDGVNFSILVQDSKGTMVYNFPDGTGISPDASGISYSPGAGSLMLPLAPLTVASAFDALSDGDGRGASFVGYLPAGTGAVAATVQEQLRKSQTTDASLEVAYSVNTATNNPRNVVAVDGFLHVINQATTGATQSTYQIFDISGECAPVIISTTNVGGLGDDYRALAVKNNRVYIGSLTTGEIKTYDITNKSAPSNINTVTISSGGVHALNVLGGVLFATGYNAGSVSAYDITTDTPVFLGDVGLGQVSVMGSYISGDYLYCCTNTTTVSFFSVNVKNPMAMTATGVALPAAAISGRNVYVSGKYAYVACIGSDSVEIINVANPASPMWVSRITIPGPSANCHWVRGIGKYLIVGAGVTSLYDATSPASPTFITSVPATGTSFDLYGDKLFIGDYPANQIKVVRCPFPTTVMQMGGALVLDVLDVKEVSADHLTADAIDANKIGVVELRSSEYSAISQSGLRVYATASQLITAGSPTIVHFSSTTYDNQAEWDGSSAFVAKSDGVYLVNASILTDSTYAAGNSGQVDVMLNGVVHSMIGWITPISTTTNRQVNGSCIVKMSKGQNIQLRWFSVGAATLISSQTNSWMSIQKLA